MDDRFADDRRERVSITPDWTTRRDGGYGEFRAALERHFARLARDSEIFRLEEAWAASPDQQ